jgi:riboflavin kinase/FMN adenylyltransferase
MQIYDTLDNARIAPPVALTIGAFDGIHLGHRLLIGETRAAANRLGGASAVLTFEPHPDHVLRPDRQRLYLTDLPTRIALIEALGIDHLFILRFDQELSRVPAETFMERVCAAMALRTLVIGADFRLGAGGRGTAAVLETIGRQLGYTVQQVAHVTLDDQPVSSTRIRQLLGEGAVAEAARLLAQPFTLRGEIIHGDHRGRTIGFPTANMQIPAEQVLPADGVYACLVALSGETQWRPAVTNIGVRPTFGTLNRTIETHLLDWSGDLYGTIPQVAFIQRLRGEQKFAGIDALIAQIQADVVAARQVLATDDTTLPL